MEYRGNKELLSLPKVGFLAASRVSSDEVMRCFDWAVQQSMEQHCVVSGFSSRMERDVLHFLLKGSCTIIVVLARSMYKVLPYEWQAAFDQGRMLVISTSDTPRQSRQTAQRRNQYVAELADTLYLAGATDTSSLIYLQQLFSFKSKTISSYHQKTKSTN